MKTVLQLQTTVLPGSRIEVASPELPVGAAVEVVISVPDDGTGLGFLEFLDRLPASERTAEEWREADREFRERRDAWDK